MILILTTVGIITFFADIEIMLEVIEITGLDSFVSLSFAWIICSVTFNMFNYDNNTELESSLLLLLGYYKTIVWGYENASSILFNNFYVLFRFFKYILKGSLNFFKKYQIWYPIFKKNGYLFLLNSSRTRWQLSKSHSVLKNK